MMVIQMKKERAITIKKDEAGHILEIKTNKGNTYDLETALELIDQGLVQSTYLKKVSK